MDKRISNSGDVVQVKLSALYYVFAFVMVSAVALTAMENIITRNEFGWLIIFGFTVLFMAPPALLVANKIEANKTDFILSFRTGKRIVISKVSLTSVDQAWIRFVAQGFASHWFGIMYIRNPIEVNKFIKAQIAKGQK